MIVPDKKCTFGEAELECHDDTLSRQLSSMSIDMKESRESTIQSTSSRDQPAPQAKKKKQKPPKPGSKKAQLASKKAKEGRNAPSHSSSSQCLAPPQVFLYNRVLILLFESAEALKSALGRPHISYEGHELKGPLKGINFPMSHYAKWCASSSHGGLSEYEVAVKNLILMYQSSAEAFPENQSIPKLIDLPPSVRPEIRANDPVYIIASLQKDASTFTHEWAHAIYHIVPAYRKLVDAAWDDLSPSLRSGIEKELSMRNYHSDMYVDEFQAYLVEGPFEFGKKWSQDLIPYHRQFKQLVSPPIFSKLGDTLRLRQY